MGDGIIMGNVMQKYFDVYIIHGFYPLNRWKILFGTSE